MIWLNMIFSFSLLDVIRPDLAFEAFSKYVEIIIDTKSILKMT